MGGCSGGQRGPSVAAGTESQLEARPPNRVAPSRERAGCLFSDH